MTQERQDFALAFTPLSVGISWCLQLVNGGEDVLVFYNDRSSFPILLQMMGSERERADEDGALAYHNTLVELLAACTEGKNVYTELKCNSLLPLDDIVKVVTDVNCIPEVGKRNSGVFVIILIIMKVCPNCVVHD